MDHGQTADALSFRFLKPPSAATSIRRVPPAGPFFTCRPGSPVPRHSPRSTPSHILLPICGTPIRLIPYPPTFRHFPCSPTDPLLGPRLVPIAPRPLAHSALLRHSAWARPSECKALPTEDIRAFIDEPHRKSGEMLEGYKIALEPSSWEAELAEAKRAHDEAMEGVDELEDDEDGEDEVGTASGAKKRKKTAAPAKDAKGKKAKVEKKAKVRSRVARRGPNALEHDG